MLRPYTIFEEFGGTEFGGIFDADKTTAGPFGHSSLAQRLRYNFRREF